MKGTKDIMRALREDGDFTQTEIAKELGISQQYYSKYETGEYEMPVRHLITLAKFYQVSVDYLVGLTEYKGHFADLSAVILDNLTVGALVSAILALDSRGQCSVADYVAFLNAKQQKAGKGS